jgi:pyruvate/2-oxoacid:ferredoxin oxidoreductase beta subunit
MLLVQNWCDTVVGVSFFHWKSHDIAGYDYQTELYCPGCAAMALISALSREGTTETEAIGHINDLVAARGIDMSDLSSYDSVDFPKPVFADQIENNKVCAGCGGALL